MLKTDWRTEIGNRLADVDAKMALGANAEPELLELQRAVKWWRWWEKAESDSVTRTAIEQEWATVKAS